MFVFLGWKLSSMERGGGRTGQGAGREGSELGTGCWQSRDEGMEMEIGD